jgi:peptidyl-prolyl cis-trans isomerase A (cyclophilin A)
MRVRSLIFLALALAACKDTTPTPVPSPVSPAQAAPKAPEPKDVISMSNIPQGPGDLYAVFQTSRGNIVVKLFEKDAPKTVANFVGLASGKQEWVDPRNGQKSKAKLYDGTVFHRVIPQFMIQGGDPLGTGTGGPGYNFKDEFRAESSIAEPVGDGQLRLTPTGRSSSSPRCPRRT